MQVVYAGKHTGAVIYNVRFGQIQAGLCRKTQKQVVL
jgi:hypothetical protein